jgi:hypothetical protein
MDGQHKTLNDQKCDIQGEKSEPRRRWLLADKVNQDPTVEVAPRELGAPRNAHEEVYEYAYDIR